MKMKCIMCGKIKDIEGGRRYSMCKCGNMMYPVPIKKVTKPVQEETNGITD